MELLPWILFAIACGLAAVGWHKVYRLEKLYVDVPGQWTRKELLSMVANLERQLKDLRDLIRPYAHEGEGPATALDRIIRERDSALAELRETTAALETRDKKMADLWRKYVKVCGELKDKRERLKRLPSRPKKPMVKKARKA